MRLWHGTNDEIRSYPYFGEAIEQWTNVHGLSQTPTSTDQPQPNWINTRYATGAVLGRVVALDSDVAEALSTGPPVGAHAEQPARAVRGVEERGVEPVRV